MKFGLWIEPEMISFNSELFKKHPEYVLFDKSVNPTTLRHQLVLDLTIKEVRDYIFESIEKIFDNYEIDYCKWDFNRIITEPISQMSSENNDCLYHKFILGTYDLLSRFIRCYPNILLETCAGGGGRFDLGMLFYSHQIWGSDETDGVSRTLIQYATNLFYPLKVIGSHISARKYLSIKEKGAIAMFGTFGYELDVTKLNEEEIEEVKIANFRFLNNKKLIDEGDYYPLISPYNNNFVSWEVVSEDKKELIFFFMNYKQVNRESRFIKLKGLDKNKYYINDFDNLKYRGDFYMNIGLNLSIGMQSFTPILIKLKETD
ncbi:MAG: alpha-galactosidase, partial [Firmicutes bacterium]|nr:alpha-galactosidase [Candidatus Onthovivens merdipullorum]